MTECDVLVGIHDALAVLCELCSSVIGMPAQIAEENSAHFVALASFHLF